MSLREFADIVGIPRGTIMRRWAKGDRGERLSRAPDQRYNKRGNFSKQSEVLHVEQST